MNNNLNENTHPFDIILPSPFHISQNQRIEIENRNRRCSHAEIDKLSSRGILNTIDFTIMKILARYRYVNAYNITIALSQELPAGYQKDNYKRNLRKLVKAGILLRYTITESISGDNYKQPTAISSPLRFYELTYGAYTYIAPLEHDRCRQSPALTDTQLLCHLAVSQFVIHLKKNYVSCLQQVMLDVQVMCGTKNILIPARIYTSATPSHPSLDICLLCVRDDAESINTLLTTAPLLSRHLEENQEPKRKSMIIILAENMCDIPDIQHRLLTKNNSVPQNLFYVTDTSILSAPLFQNLFLCHESNLQYRILHYSLTTKPEAPH